MSNKQFIAHLKNGDILFTKADLKRCVVESMADYIERRITSEELLELTELIETRYLSRTTEDVSEAIKKLHKMKQIYKNFEEEMTDDDMTELIVESLLILTKNKY